MNSLYTASVALLVCLPALAQPQSSGSATYEVTFNSIWSATTHPGAFPGGAHWSPLIGGTHSDAVTFWEPAGIATSGFETMAETGSPVPFRDEVNAAIGAGTGLDLIEGSGIGTPASTSEVFTVTTEHSFVTLVTMIAPSPDWFVGVHGLELLDAQGRFVDQIVVPLLAYDAGTDNGVNFTSSNQDQTPHAPIERVTGGPFTGNDPLGTFTFTRVQSTQTYGSGLNPAGSLVHLTGEHIIGQTVLYTLGDPTGGMNTPALSLLLVSGSPAAGFPTAGLILPQFGLASLGAPSELLIGLPAIVTQTGPTYNGSPVTFALSIPLNTALVGQALYVQGALADGSRVGITNAYEVVIGE